MGRPRVILGDDHTMLLDAFRTLLAESCDVVGTAADGRQLVALARQLRPDVAIVDISMPVLNGLDASAQIIESIPRVRVIILTMDEDPQLAVEAFRLGASGYLLKKSAGTELLQAVREVTLGRSYITPLLTHGLVTAMAEHSVAGARGPLTTRQREIVQLIAEGRSMKEVAGILNITPRTVAFHKHRVLEKLQLGSTAELIQYAVRHHIV